MLGHFSVEDSHGTGFLPRTRKTRALLAILALASPRPVLRLQLASLLWSRREKEQARASLRQSVHELQDTFGSPWQHVVQTDRHHLTLRSPDLDIDVQALMQPADLSLDLLKRYKDPLLEDLDGLDPAFDHWLQEERTRLNRIARSVAETLLAQCTDPAQAADTAEAVLAVDRHHEGAWRALIRGHAQRGDVPAALHAYERFRGILADTPNARPSAETEDLSCASAARPILKPSPRHLSHPWSARPPCASG